MSEVIRKYRFLIIAVCWLLTQFVYFKINGIVDDKEALKYLGSANRLLDTGSFNPIYLFFSGYVLFLSACLGVGLKAFGIVLIQCAVSITGVYFFSKTLEKLFQWKTALIGSIFFAVYYQVQVWNFHLYSDGVSLNLVVIFLYLLHSRELNSRQNLIGLSLFLISLIFTRPTNILFLIPCLLMVLDLSKLKSLKSYVVIKGFTIVTMLAFGATIYYYRQVLFPEFPNGQIICGIGDSFNDLTILESVKMFFQRIGLFLSQYRGYYSSLHNVLLLPLVPFLLSTLIYLFKGENTPFRRFYFNVIIIFILSVGLTCANWHGRFIIPLIPILIITGLNGFEVVIQKKID